MRRKLLILALLLAVTGPGAYVLYLHSLAPPAAVLLLPEGNLLAYVNLRLVRPFWDLSKSKPVALEGDYKEFVNQTGIQFERDLDEVAASWQGTSAGRDFGSAAIFAGSFDSSRLKAYLQKNSSQEEIYRDLIIYSIPNQDHIVRVCALDGRRVATSTAPSSETMHGIIDRIDRSGKGPWLLQTYYRHIPATSLAWIIDRFHRDSTIVPQGLITNLSFLDNTIAVGSLRYKGSLFARADVFAVNAADAQRVFDSANAFITLSGFFGKSKGIRDDADVKAALDSIHVAQQGNVVTITAECPGRLLNRIQNEMKAEAAAAPAANMRNERKP
jgi:hypothetical protein